MSTDEKRKQYKKDWYEKNKETVKSRSEEWYEKNKDRINKERRDRNKNDEEYHKKILENKKEYYKRTKDTVRKEYLERNKDRLAEYRKEYNKEYREENKEKLSEDKKEYYQKNKELFKERSKNNKREPASYDIWFERLKKYNECRRDPKNLELLQVRCKYDDMWFNPTNQQVQDRYKTIHGLKPREFSPHELYCSHACKETCPIYGQIK